ncbi:hypothetical protein [Pelagimonas varians]|uniref:Uncharacterized protein n=1 Tax=Pelagimonas varians TaxID=696760 RepID=A0A238KXW6_9RHOB|nr:hypothetical protein [Pelagimonas varians]PYG28013.1 hypothetical protein C8N36_11345 [Pelagimonas varians]SMX47052.1 hypothetical protein PEV8663_03457 [Pelagimonas varians]
MNFPISKSLLYAAVGTFLFASAEPVQAQNYGLADLTFQIRVKVEGNVAAINSGIDVRCSIHTVSAVHGDISRVQTVNILPPGQVFSPQTPDGFIELDVTLKDWAYWEHRSDGTRVEHPWYCDVFPTEQGASPGFTVANPPYTAIAPADAGTCTRATGVVSSDGSQKDIIRRCPPL